MAQPFVGEIRIFGFNFAPRGWMFCNGQLLPIAQYATVFSILGTYYGGNGQTNFALPNFQNNAPVAQGNGPGLSSRVVGEIVGEAQVSLLDSQIPPHTHALIGAQASVPATQLVATPSPTAWEGQSAVKLFAPAPGTTTFSPQTVGITGNGLPHNNVQPILALNFCIAIEGIFPARN